MKAPRLRQGDTVGMISPSWGGGAAYPHRVQRGVEYLESLGFRVGVAPHAMNSAGYVSDTAENRVADVHELLLDPEVKAAVAMIGGDHSCHLLPLLDFDLIREHPTILMGYSDVTVLNVAIWAHRPRHLQRTGAHGRGGGVPEGIRLHGAAPAREAVLGGAGRRDRTLGAVDGGVLQRTEGYDFPVVADMDFGHTPPMFTLPAGCRAVIDAGRRRFEIVEAAVR